MKKLILLFGIIAVLASCNQHQLNEGYLPVTTKSDSAAIEYFKANDVFHYRGIPGSFQSMDRAIAFDSSFFMAYVYKANVYHYQGNSDRFVEYANKALSCNISLNKAEKVWKEILEALLTDNKADVCPIAQKFVDLYPEVAESYLNLSSFYVQKEDFTNGLLNIDKAIELTPDDPNLHCIRGYELYFNGQYDKAIQEFTIYQKLLPDSPNVYDSFGDCYLAMKDYQSAYENFMKAHELGWSDSKAKKAKQLMLENSFTSLHLINLKSAENETEFMRIIGIMNETLVDMGYGNIRYQVSKARNDQPSKYDYILLSVWPNQGVYDIVHEAEDFKAQMQKWGDSFTKLIKEQINTLYGPLN